MSALVVCFMAVVSPHGVEAQEHTLRAGVRALNIFSGEFGASYDQIAGVQVDYMLGEDKRLRPFATAGVDMSLSGTAAQLTTADLGLGVMYDVLDIAGRPLFVSVAAGGLYYSEQFSVDLIDRSVENSVNEIGFRADVGIGYQIFDRLSAQLRFVQYHDQATTAGVSIHYHFL